MKIGKFRSFCFFSCVAFLLLLCCASCFFARRTCCFVARCCFFAWKFTLLFCFVASLLMILVCFLALLLCSVLKQRRNTSKKARRLSKQQSNTSNKATEQAIGCFFACEQQFFCVSHPALESSFRNKTGIQLFLCFIANLWASHQSDCCSRDWQRQTFFLIRNKFSKSLFLGSFETETVKLNHLFLCQSLQYRENF